MARLRKGHWRHIASDPEHPDAFECGEHARVCRRVWVSPQQPSNGTAPAEAALFDLEPDQVAYNERAVSRRDPQPPQAGHPNASTRDQDALRPTRRRLRDRLRGLLARLRGR